MGPLVRTVKQADLIRITRLVPGGKPLKLSQIALSNDVEDDPLCFEELLL